MNGPDAMGDPQLRALEEELRTSWPHTPLSPGFARRLEDRLVAESRFPRLVRRSPLLRLAAALLVACTLAAPATAVLVLLARREPAPVVVFAPAAPADGLVPRPLPAAEPVPPPDLPDLLETGWVQARQRDNRLALASLQWRQRFPVAGRAPAGLPSGLEMPFGARLGLELRLGLRAPPAGPLAEDWAEAPADLLWAELERRLARGESAPPPEGLVARVHRLWEEEPDAGTRGWLASWLEILDGPGAGAGYPLPEPGGAAARLFWDAVPWRPHFPPALQR